jgi:tRNA modification GTPase
MKMKTISDTIAAIATPPGEGGIAVIRVSGKNAINVVGPLFSGKNSIQDALPRTAMLGAIADAEGEVLDSVIITVFIAPHSYTGETVVEVSCHGGFYISRRVLDAIIANGARHALPGEFTERAFLNGKIDLSQAEAVAELIHARSESARKASREQLHGRLGNRVRSLRQELLELCALLELELDFSEEDIELAGRREVAARLGRTITAIEEMSRSFISGKLIREGVRTVLAGRPNTGKSSLLNILLRENRSIVSEIPGTTRDVIEESVSIEGVLFRLADTAGLRKTADEVEREGIRRTESQLDNADLILYLLDTSKSPDFEDISFLNLFLNSSDKNGTKAILVLNKSDICIPDWSIGREWKGVSSTAISCKSHQGIDELKRQMLQAILPVYDSSSTSPMILSGRHRTALDDASRALHLAEESIVRGMSYEFAAVDMHQAMNSLGEIIGLTTSDDILQTIFSQFCIGK